MLSVLLVARALAADPVFPSTVERGAPEAAREDVPLADPLPRPPRSGLHRAGLRTLTVGAVTTAAALPAGLITLGVVEAECARNDSFECMQILLAPAVTGLVGTVGLGTMAVGGTLLAVDAARGPREVTVGIAPTGLVVAGRF